MPCRMLGIILRPLENPLRKTCALCATGWQTRRFRANRSPCLVWALTISCARLSFLELLSRLEDRTAQINQSVRAVRAVKAVRAVRATRMRIASSPRTAAIISVAATQTVIQGSFKKARWSLGGLHRL